MVEARNKRTREVKVFAPETWEMMEKSGLARRNWDFVRVVQVVVPPEVEDKPQILVPKTGETGEKKAKTRRKKAAK